MYGSLHVLYFPSDNCFQDEEYDSWDAIADYVFQVTPLPHVIAGPPHPHMKELKC